MTRDFIAPLIDDDAPIERSLFGTDDPGEIWGFVGGLCPEAEECFAFEASVGALFGLRLRDGSRVALKVHLERPGREEELASMQRVQAHLVARGFPCPRPLGVRGRATLEEWRDEGVYLDAHEPEVRRVVARSLAQLVRLTGELGPLPGLEPFFPRAEGPLWPKPHNVLFDFEATAAGAGWIDEVAAAAKPLRSAGRLVLGHGDWTVKHFRFDRLRPTVIYDWDSIGTDFEAVFVGNAAASFTYTEHLPVPLWPTAAEALAFVDDYEAARGEAFSDEERRAVGAAAIYSRAYTARCVHALGGDAQAMALDEYVLTFR